MTPCALTPRVRVPAELSEGVKGDTLVLLAVMNGTRERHALVGRCVCRKGTVKICAISERRGRKSL